MPLGAELEGVGHREQDAQAAIGVVGRRIGQRLGNREAELDRLEVYQATGMLMAQLGIEAAAALARLRAHAYTVGQSASEVARDVHPVASNGRISAFSIVATIAISLVRRSSMVGG